MEYDLNKINIKLFTQEVGWLGGKGIKHHTWDPRNKLHMWHSLWSTLEYWRNILYWPKLSRLGDYLGDWNVPHHVLNDYYSKHLIHNDFRAISHFLYFMIGIKSWTQSYIWNFFSDAKKFFFKPFVNFTFD